MDVQMETAVFKPTNLFSLLSFSDNFKTFCDGNTIYEGAAKWLFPHLICEPAKAGVTHRVTADKRNRQLERKLAT